MPQAKKPKKSAKKLAKSAAKRPARKAVKKTATKRKTKAAAVKEREPKPLTFQERSFVKEYAQNGGNGTQAALAVGMGTNENAAAVAASDKLRSPKIQEAIEFCFSVAGLSERDVVQGYLEGFRAFKVTWVEDPTDTVNGGYRALMTPDFEVRRKNHDMYFKLTGKYAPLRVAVENDFGDVLRFLFDREAPKALTPPPIELKEGKNGFVSD